MFDFLTLSVVIDNSIFCVHGGKKKKGYFRADYTGPRTNTDERIGLSPTIHVLDQIKIIDRFKGKQKEGYVKLR